MAIFTLMAPAETPLGGGYRCGESIRHTHQGWMGVSDGKGVLGFSISDGRGPGEAE